MLDFIQLYPHTQKSRIFFLEMRDKIELNSERKFCHGGVWGFIVNLVEQRR